MCYEPPEEPGFNLDSAVLWAIVLAVIYIIFG